MDNLIFPPFEYRTNQIHGKLGLFDIIRKKFIVVTPEEWVRQHLIHYLVYHMKYPKSLTSVEDGMKVNRMAKRSDVIVYDQNGNVFLAVECKSTKVKMTQKIMDQLSIYNQHYKAAYLAVTNGLDLYICKMDYENHTSKLIDNFPEFPDRE